MAELARAWDALPAGARAALAEQWAGLAAGGLPCGASVVDAAGRVVAVGRNHAYDPAGALDTRARYPLQRNRLAHAELNALALLDTATDHAALTLWTTQHPCAMCAAALGPPARSGIALPTALAAHYPDLARVAAQVQPSVG